jgi:single-strand DNA-binding protein
MSVNLAVVRGTCSSPADVRVLASGSTLASLQVTSRAADGTATSVPVVAGEPPAWVEALAEGDEVVAVGRVRRRFYRAAGGTGSRVEVEVVQIARATDRRRVQTLMRRATESIEQLLD